MILIKPLMAMAARRRLAVLYQERDSLSAAIDRARKRKKAVSGLYDAAKKNTALTLYWEGFLR
jgi:lipopolysaccharide biosynthesis regulator YciM